MFLFLLLPILIFANNYTSLMEFNLSTPHTYKLMFSEFNIQKCETNVDLNISNKVELAKYEYYNNDLGLFLDTGGNINDKSGKQSLNIGLTWKLLNGGYKDNQDKAQIVKLQNRLNQLENTQVKNSFNYYNDYNFIIYFYNKKKIFLLNKYLKFLSLKFKIFKDKYFLKATTIDKILSIKQKIDDAKHLQNTYKIFNKKVICKNKILGEIPDFDLKYNVIEKDIKNYNNFIKKFRLKDEIIDRKLNRYNQWKFDLYANRELLRNQGDNFGFDIQIPLTKNPDELKRVEKLKALSDQYQNDIRKYLYLQKNYYVFRYKLSTLINMRFKLAYVKAQLARAKLRYGFHIGQGNIDRIISNIDSEFAIKLQILDIKQQLLLQSYSLLYNLGLKFDNKYIKPISIDTNLHLRNGNRSLYIWANGFKRYKNNLLIEFLKLKNIKTVMISISKYQNFKKLKNFIKLANKNHIKVIYLLQYKHKMRKLDYNISEVNIYINKEDKNLNLYLDYFHKKHPNYKIDITLPNPKIVVPIVNKVYSKNADVIVINAKKFSNELELELNIEKIIKKNPNIAIYDLKTYMKVLQ